MVSGISMTADLVADSSKGAFVYGAFRYSILIQFIYLFPIDSVFYLILTTLLLLPSSSISSTRPSSFGDKLANGLLIQLSSPYSKESHVVRVLMSLVPSIAVAIGVFVSFTIVKYYSINRQKKAEEKQPLLH